MEDFVVQLPAYPNLVAYGRLQHFPDGNWPRVYVYSFCELFSSYMMQCAVSFVEDDSNLGNFIYAVNEKAILPPFNQDLVDGCVANFELKFGITPVYVGPFGQKTGADRYLVVSAAIPAAIFTAWEYRDFTTGLRQVLYSIEDSGGGTTTMLNAVRYFESDFNVWESPVVSPNLVATFGGAILIEITKHFTTNFDF